MRRDQHITLTRNNSQTDLIVIQDGDLEDEYLDLTEVTPDDVIYHIAEGTVEGTVTASDVIYESDPNLIEVVDWGSTDAQWPDRFKSDEDGVEWDIAPPPDSTLLVYVEIPASETQQFLASPTAEGTTERTPELLRECKLTAAGDLGADRRAITVVQGDVTVLPSTDDGTGQA